MKLLDELGIKCLTDKSSLGHGYLEHYERLFAPYRDSQFTILEIGVDRGGSLRLWEEYFPRANVVGLDIRLECKQYGGGRRIVEIASQADFSAMDAIGRKHSPAIVIDDGSHQADHILTAFTALYPHLRDGGLYIVEDLEMHAGAAAPAHRGGAGFSPQSYFLRLANCIACPAEQVDFDPKISRTVEAVEFSYCISVVRKKQAPDELRVDERRTLVERIDSHETWGWFSRYLLANGGSPCEAVKAAKRAVSIQRSPLHLSELARALESVGQFAEAMEIAQEAVESTGSRDTQLRTLLARLQDKARPL